MLLLIASPADSAPPPQESTITLVVLGRVVDTHGNGVANASVSIYVGGVKAEVGSYSEGSSDSTRTQFDGSYIAHIEITPELAESLRTGKTKIAVEVSKPTYLTVRQGIIGRRIARDSNYCYVEVPEIVLPHVKKAAFFIAVGIFLLVLTLIGFKVVHETVASLLGASLMLGVSYILGTFDRDFRIISFERAISFIDFDVIFLVMSLMIFVALLSRTGLFQWLAFQAYKLGGGKPYVIAGALSLLTAFISAFLNNVTVMLLIGPVTIEMALMLGIHPVSFLIPEVLASNVGGAATLIGDPPNTIIGSYAHLSFNEFLLNLGPVVLLSYLALMAVVFLLYRGQYRRKMEEPSPELLEQLKREAAIKDKATLKKTLLVAVITVMLFFSGELFKAPPGVVALLGATALLLWVRPGVEEMLKEVDWTTLVFFMSLFIMVGGIYEVGLIHMVADFVRNLAGGSLTVTALFLIWVSALFSALVANIPFTAAMLPVVAYLTSTIPGASNNALYWALAMGACFGGNATTIGAAANIVTVGLADRAGYEIGFADFLKVGLPATVATLVVASLWMIIRY